MTFAARLGAALVVAGAATLLAGGPALGAAAPSTRPAPGPAATARPAPEAGLDLALPVVGGGAVLAGGTWLLLAVRRVGERGE